MTAIFDTPAYELECRIQAETLLMTEAGTRCDPVKLDALDAALQTAASDLAAQLQAALPAKRVETVFLPKRNNKTKGYIAGEPFTKVTMVPFNPNSSMHIAERLQALGWQPTVLTESGEPSTAAAVLATLPYPEVVTLMNFKMVEKRLGLLNGPKGWRASLGADGYFHTEYRCLGARTHRASHRLPNISQIPKVLLDPSTKQPLLGVPGKFGYECRDMVSGPPGWLLVGTDQQGLELRCFAGYLYKFDGGDYARLVCEGDPHKRTQEATGLTSRDRAKTLIYAALYGGGSFRLGSIVEPEETDDHIIRAVGKEVKTALIEGIGGCRELFDWIDNAPNNELTGLDGRLLVARKPHTRLNTLLQSAGAIICKRWIVLVAAELRRIGLRWGWDGDYAIIIWSHDEIQTACRTQEIAEIVAKVCVEQAVAAGEYYNFGCPTAGAAKIGWTWAETH